MKKILQRVLAVLAVAAVLLGVSATAAAAAGPASCPSPQMCIYTGTNYSGSRYDWSPVDGCVVVGYPYNQPNHSMWNRSSRQVRLFPQNDSACSNWFYATNVWPDNGLARGVGTSSFYFWH